MWSPKRCRIRRACAGSGLLAAVLALVSQIVLGTLVIPDDATGAQNSALEAASTLCAGLPDPAPQGPAQQFPHAPDHALCPLSIALAVPVFVLGPMLDLPQRPRMIATGTVALPPARGPPAPATRVGTPRGPPPILA